MKNKLFEEKGPYQYEPWCDQAGESIADGTVQGDLYGGYSYGPILINGEDASTFFKSEYIKNWVLQEISYPVKDGHPYYNGLDMFFNNYSYNVDLSDPDIQADLIKLGFDEEEIKNLAKLGKAKSGNIKDVTEIETWIDYDIQIDESDVEDDEYEKEEVEESVKLTESTGSQKTVETIVPFFYGFYESIFEEYWNSKEEVGKIFTDVINKKIAEVLPSFSYTFQHVQSPKYYNYGTDEIYAQANFNLDEVLAFLSQNLEAFESYCKENFSDRDGFWSYLPNSAEKFIETMKTVTGKDESSFVFGAIEFIMEKAFGANIKNELNEEAYYDCNDQLEPDEYEFNDDDEVEESYPFKKNPVCKDKRIGSDNPSEDGVSMSEARNGQFVGEKDIPITNEQEQKIRELFDEACGKFNLTYKLEKRVEGDIYIRIPLNYNGLYRRSDTKALMNIKGEMVCWIFNQKGFTQDGSAGSYDFDWDKFNKQKDNEEYWTDQQFTMKTWVSMATKDYRQRQWYGSSIETYDYDDNLAEIGIEKAISRAIDILSKSKKEKGIKKVNESFKDYLPRGGFMRDEEGNKQGAFFGQGTDEQLRKAKIIARVKFAQGDRFGRVTKEDLDNFEDYKEAYDEMFGSDEIDEGWKDNLKKAAGVAAVAGGLMAGNAHAQDSVHYSLPDGAQNPETEYSELFQGAKEIDQINQTVTDQYGNVWTFDEWQDIKDGNDPFGEGNPPEEIHESQDPTENSEEPAKKSEGDTEGHPISDFPVNDTEVKIDDIEVRDNAWEELDLTGIMSKIEKADNEAMLSGNTAENTNVSLRTSTAKSTTAEMKPSENKKQEKSKEPEIDKTDQKDRILNAEKTKAEIHEGFEFKFIKEAEGDNVISFEITNGDGFPCVVEVSNKSSGQFTADELKKVIERENPSIWFNDAEAKYWFMDFSFEKGGKTYWMSSDNIEGDMSKYELSIYDGNDYGNDDDDKKLNEAQITGQDSPSGIDFLKTLDEKGRYMFLSRMQQDCKYFLGNGNYYNKFLWAGNVEDQIKYMKWLYNSFPKNKKPEWISMEEIEDYEKRMVGKGKEDHSRDEIDEEKEYPGLGLYKEFDDMPASFWRHEFETASKSKDFDREWVEYCRHKYEEAVKKEKSGKLDEEQMLDEGKARLDTLHKLMDKCWYNSKDGKGARLGNWEMALGGYDKGYEFYYNNMPLFAINRWNEIDFYQDTENTKKYCGYTNKEIFDSLKSYRDLNDLKTSEELDESATNEQSDNMSLLDKLYNEWKQGGDRENIKKKLVKYVIHTGKNSEEDAEKTIKWWERNINKENNNENKINQNVLQELYDVICEAMGDDYLSDYDEVDYMEFLDCIKDFGNDIEGFDDSLAEKYATALKSKWKEEHSDDEDLDESTRLKELASKMVLREADESSMAKVKINSIEFKGKEGAQDDKNWVEGKTYSFEEFQKLVYEYDYAFQAQADNGGYDKLWYTADITVDYNRKQEHIGYDGRLDLGDGKYGLDSVSVAFMVKQGVAHDLGIDPNQVEILNPEVPYDSKAFVAKYGTHEENLDKFLADKASEIKTPKYSKDSDNITPEEIEVGDYFADNDSNGFYRVVRRSKASVWLEKVKSKVIRVPYKNNRGELEYSNDDYPTTEPDNEDRWSWFDTSKPFRLGGHGHYVSASQGRHSLWFWGGKEIAESFAKKGKALMEDEEVLPEADQQFENPFKEGDILFSSWGYSMRLVDFYKVISSSKSFVKLAHLQDYNSKQDEWGQAGYKMPKLDQVEPDSNVDGRRFKVHIRDDGKPFVKINNYEWAEMWDGKPKAFDTYD